MPQNRLQAERIDSAVFTMRSMSYNVPGHEDRMQALCEKEQRGKQELPMTIKEMNEEIARLDE